MVQVIEPSASETEKTVASHCSFVTGDRLCIRCGYNLIGQSILREPHYNLLIARCPECGAVAGVQEYPLLGPWAHRWGMIIAALWFILIIGFWAGSSGTIMGLSLGVAEESGRNYERYISRLHDESVEQQKLLQQQANRNRNRKAIYQRRRTRPRRRRQRTAHSHRLRHRSYRQSPRFPTCRPAP